MGQANETPQIKEQSSATTDTVVPNVLIGETRDTARQDGSTETTSGAPAAGFFSFIL